MALVRCFECGREVSSYAASCPHCGCPVPRLENEVQTIQKTSKRIKAILVITFLSMVVGCSGMLIHDSKQHGPDDSALVWTLTMLVGAVGFVVTKFAQWWEHG